MLSHIFDQTKEAEWLQLVNEPLHTHQDFPKETQGMHNLAMLDKVAKKYDDRKCQLNTSDHRYYTSRGSDEGYSIIVKMSKSSLFTDSVPC